jgi:uncharacterized protein YjbJ (UPF0337 family)
MNWDQIQGKWKEMKGTVRQKFGQLTDSDYEQIAGNREKFLGRLQERYGYTRDKAELELNDFLRTATAQPAAGGTQTPPKTQAGGGSH